MSPYLRKTGMEARDFSRVRLHDHYEYASDLTDANVIELDCGHYVHNFMQNKIAEDIREFLDE
jgi:hypothetical protein